MPNDNQTELQEGLPNGDQKIDTSQDSQDQSTQDKEKVEHEPAVDSPRWKQVYKSWKDAERKIEELVTKDVERDRAIEVMRAHQKALTETMMGVEDKFDDLSKPDRELEPDKYDEWLAKKIKRDLKKEEEKKTEFPKTTQFQQFQQGKADIKELEFAEEHSDYYEVIADIAKELPTNPQLRTQIYSTSHPYEAAYRIGQARKRATQRKKDALEDQGFVEGDNQPLKKGKVALSNDEKRAAKMLGISEEKYAEQKQFIETRGW